MSIVHVHVKDVLLLEWHMGIAKDEVGQGHSSLLPGHLTAVKLQNGRNGTRV
jgi:hypothetical protein